MSRHRRLAALAASVALLVGTAPMADADVRAPAATTKVEVASYNLYLGGDVGVLLAPGVDTLSEFLAAAAALWQNVVATDFPERAEAIADLLAKDHPDVVGLQEVALWETAPAGAALAPTYDFLAILRAELAERDAPYKVLVTNTNFVSPPVPLPPPLGLTVRLTDRDVVIARADLPKSELKPSNAGARTYTASVPITLPTGGTAEIIRGWSTVDIKTDDMKYRFANTHLEAFSDTVRDRQAGQLVRALRRSPHPVVLVGDLNADPGTDAARILKKGVGMDDAWAKGKGKGYTAGQDDLLHNDPSTLSRRIDYVYYESGRQPDIAAKKAHVIGEAAADRTPSGLWPSDHAGVWARLALAPQ